MHTTHRRGHLTLTCSPAGKIIQSPSNRCNAAPADDEGAGGERRELDRLFDEMQRQNTKSGLVDGVKQTIDRLPLPDLSEKPLIDTSKPFRFPAYGFLLISVLLGISFTGSLTELATGSPLVSNDEEEA